MISDEYINKLNNEIIKNIETDSLFKARKQTGDTAEEIASGNIEKVGENKLIKYFPPYMDNIGGGNTIVNDAVEKALGDTTDFFIDNILSQIDNTLIKI